MLKGCTFAEEVKVKLTQVEVKDLKESEFLIIFGRVSPSRVWRKGDTLVVAGHRDYYEFQEVRKKMVEGLKRFFVVSTDSYAFCTDENLVQRV